MPRTPRTKNLEETSGVIEVVNTDGCIVRKGYKIYFCKPEEQTLLNDLQSTGKVFNIVSVDCETPNDGVDELAVFIKK